MKKEIAVLFFLLFLFINLYSQPLAPVGVNKTVSNLEYIHVVPCFETDELNYTSSKTVILQLNNLSSTWNGYQCLVLKNSSNTSLPFTWQQINHWKMRDAGTADSCLAVIRK